ncbi:MAG: lecithin retinol acyltransferase family protein [Synergistaceae bacterium]|nr:lecithin retinol acyltransferase family protein [Synergistaceae bacterium]
MKNNPLLPLLLSAGASRHHTQPQPQNGDVLRVNRGLYSHYGVYVAESNHVIHYTGANGPNDFNGIVRETTLDEFLNGSPTFSVCTFPEHPQTLTPSPQGKAHSLFQLWQLIKSLKLKDYHLYSGDEAVARARSRLGQGGYNLALNNCEHFAVWCRTGIRDSSQVNHILDIITYFLS